MSKEIENDEFGGIFNLSQDDIKAKIEAGTGAGIDPDFYRPNIEHKQAKNREYSATGRFVPNVNTRGLHVVRKMCYYLPDAHDPQKKFYTDCPSNGGVPKNIISQAFFDMKDHDSAQMSAIAKQWFGRKEYFWRLFYILEDKQDPTLEGTIKILRYGKKVEEKIDQQGIDNPKAGQKAVNIIDPFYGKNFALNIKEVPNDKGGKITSYEGSYFLSDKTPILINGKEATLDEAGKAEVFEFLKKAPDLSKVVYKPWEAEEEQRVIEAVKALVDDDALFNKIYRKVYQKDFFSAGKIPSAQSETKAEVNNLTDKVSKKTETKAETKTETKAETKVEEKTEEKAENKSVVDETGKVDYSKVKINFNDVD